MPPARPVVLLAQHHAYHTSCGPTPPQLRTAPCAATGRAWRQVRPALRELGQVESWEVAHAARLDELLALWAQMLAADPAAPEGGGAGAGPGGRPLFVQPREALWLGLKVLLQCLRPEALMAAVQVGGWVGQSVGRGETRQGLHACVTVALHTME